MVVNNEKQQHMATVEKKLKMRKRIKPKKDRCCFSFFKHVAHALGVVFDPRGASLREYYYCVR
jgi:hypothetical protein